MGTQTDFVASSAIFISLSTILTILTFVPVIVNKVSEIQAEVQDGSEDFQVLVGQTWSKIVKTRQSLHPAYVIRYN